jgi:hypothetical protein
MEAATSPHNTYVPQHDAGWVTVMPESEFGVWFALFYALAGSILIYVRTWRCGRTAVPQMCITHPPPLPSLPFPFLSYLSPRPTAPARPG